MILRFVEKSFGTSPVAPRWVSSRLEMPPLGWNVKGAVKNDRAFCFLPC
jgi:hypothetical protein